MCVLWHARKGVAHDPTRRHRGRWRRRPRRSPGAPGPRGRSGPHQRSHRRPAHDLPPAVGRRAVRERARAAVRLGAHRPGPRGSLDSGCPRRRASRCARGRHQGRSAGSLRRAAAGGRRPAGASAGGCHPVRRRARRPGHQGDDRGAGARAPPHHRVRRHGRHRVDPAALRAGIHDGRVRAAARAGPGDRADQQRVRAARRLRRRRQRGRTAPAERRRNSLSHRHLPDRPRSRDRAPSPARAWAARPTA